VLGVAEQGERGHGRRVGEQPGVHRLLLGAQDRARRLDRLVQFGLGHEHHGPLRTGAGAGRFGGARHLAQQRDRRRLTGVGGTAGEPFGEGQVAPRGRLPGRRHEHVGVRGLTTGELPRGQPQQVVPAARRGVPQ
jgi:hypothetical protein